MQIQLFSLHIASNTVQNFGFIKFNHFVDSSIVKHQFLHTEKNKNDRSKLITLVIPLSEDIGKFEKKCEKNE